jgi:hypothetical protein
MASSPDPATRNGTSGRLTKPGAPRPTKDTAKWLRGPRMRLAGAPALRLPRSTHYSQRRQQLGQSLSIQPAWHDPCCWATADKKRGVVRSSSA